VVVDFIQESSQVFHALVLWLTGWQEAQVAGKKGIWPAKEIEYWTLVVVI